MSIDHEQIARNDRAWRLAELIDAAHARVTDPVSPLSASEWAVQANPLDLALVGRLDDVLQGRDHPSRTVPSGRTWVMVCFILRARETAKTRPVPDDPFHGLENA